MGGYVNLTLRSLERLQAGQPWTQEQPLIEGTALTVQLPAAKQDLSA